MKWNETEQKPYAFRFLSRDHTETRIRGTARTKLDYLDLSLLQLEEPDMLLHAFFMLFEKGFRAFAISLPLRTAARWYCAPFLADRCCSVGLLVGWLLWPARDDTYRATYTKLSVRLFVLSLSSLMAPQRGGNLLYSRLKFKYPKNET